jgi:tRNA(Ile)-lysidine synthase
MSAPLAALEAAGDLLPTGRPVLVACSGGRDSMSLVRALLMTGRWPVRAATVDHGLRPESADDAAFVAAALAAWDVPVTVLRAEGPLTGEGPEDAARRARYRLLEAHAAQVGAERLLTAHTADDQAETLLMRLAAGTGGRGMAGMPERRGIVARPWLRVTRGEVAAFAAAHGVPWRHDSSNDSEQFLRNHSRVAVTPAMARVFGASWTRAAARTAALVRGDVEALEYLAALWRDEIGRVTPVGADLDAVRLAAAPRALRLRLLRDVLAEMAPSIRSMEAHVRRLDDLLISEGGVARLGLPRGLEARRGYGRLVIGPTFESKTPAPLDVTGPGVWRWGAWSLRIDAVDGLPADRGDACLAAPFPWRVRAPFEGERYRPLGAPGGKRVSRLWIDARVPRERRAEMPAIEAGGRLVWVAPLRIAEEARARPGEPVWRIRLEREYAQMVQ